jgi:hypothetical protein
MRRSLLPFLALSLAYAQPGYLQNGHAQNEAEPSFISPQNGLSITKQTKADILTATCDGEVMGDICSRCPVSDEEHPWSITGLVIGHFSSPHSEEAFAGVGSCFYSGSANPIGLMLAKRDGKWTRLEEILAFDPGKCMRRRLRSGREFLICESFESTRDSERLYSLSTLLVENGHAKFHNLFTASDTTRACREGKAQQAAVKKVEFRDLNGDGWEDIAITASYGSFQMTGAVLEQCDAAEDDYIQSDVRKPAVFFPKPRAVRTYRIDLLFDGNRYTPSPESKEAVALFHVTR